ncbi:MAG: GxxExxY protein [Anaerolineales bacterium]|nr:GxxExxY protein [Anaerolineales bacterium]
MATILFKELSYAVVGAAMEVHRGLGPGYLERVYQMAMAHELGLRGIVFVTYRKLTVRYKNVIVGDYEADFVVEDKIILEIKAVARLHARHEVQTLNYLTATGLRLGILMNFGASSLQTKRVVR